MLSRAWGCSVTAASVSRLTLVAALTAVVVVATGAQADDSRLVAIGDSHDEVVGVDRGATRSVYLFSATDPSGDTWSRDVIDDGDMAASGCAVEDVNADARLDIVCIGSGTANLKWHENVTP